LCIADEHPTVFNHIKMTCFSEEEEHDLYGSVSEPNLTSILATKRSDLSVTTSQTPHVVVDGSFVTGQNPQSSQGVAEQVAIRVQSIMLDV
jgi:putative intracellular protease/amidase